jgi:hypothetical protein
MARTGAERQAAWRQRKLDAAAENERLRAEVDRLSAELREAASAPARPRCPKCGGDLACPSCNRNWD